jgi:DNA-binding NtrC family response regulator
VNILFIHQDPEMQEEINEYLNLNKGQGLFARDTEEAIRFLNNDEISLVVLQIRNLRDAAILRYINQYYQDLEVLILASKEYNDIISVFSKGRYKLSNQPQHMSALKENIDSYYHIRS